MPPCTRRRSLFDQRWLFAAVLSSLVCLPLSAALAADESIQPVVPAASPMIVVGFLGGFVRANDIRHSEVQLAQKLGSENGDRVRVGVFGNWHRHAAHGAIVKWLDVDTNGILSIEEKQNARIILFGHSWGASAVVSLARQLKREGIPVLLTIQVDSIAKPGQNDRIIPENVARAVNFYQTSGLLHGTPKVVPLNAAHTEIVGNFRLQYKEAPAECSQYPWFTRHVFPGHTAIECDPKVWSQVESLIDHYWITQQYVSEARVP